MIFSFSHMTGKNQELIDDNWFDLANQNTNL